MVRLSPYLLLVLLADPEAPIPEELFPLHDRLGETLLVAAVGPETREALERGLRLQPALDLVLVTVPWIGEEEPEMALALGRSGLR